MLHDRPLYVLEHTPERCAALMQFLPEFFPNVFVVEQNFDFSSEAPCLVLAADHPQALSRFHEARRIDKRVAVIAVGDKRHFEQAVSLLQAGVDEFVLLDSARDFSGLPLAINRACKAREKFLAIEYGRNEALHHALTLATILNHVHDAVLSFSDEGHVLLFNKQAEALFGYNTNDILHQSVLLLFPVHMREEAWRLLTEVLHVSANKSTEFLAQHINGDVFPVELSCRRIRLSGQNQYVITLKDISARKEVEAALHFHITLEGFISSVATDLINRPSAHIPTAVESALATIGKMCRVHSAYLLMEDTSHQLHCVGEWSANGVTPIKKRSPSMKGDIAPEFKLRLLRGDEVLIQDSRLLTSGQERRLVRGRRVTTLLLIPLRMGDYVQGIMGLESRHVLRPWNDVEISMMRLIAAVFANAIARQRRELALEALSSELADANVRLHQQARKDSLTGLYNRRHFDDVLAHEYRRASRDQKPLAVLYCDVDYFKAYNDLYGHSAGDACLIKVALVLQESFQRSGDLCARYGGEEFVVILPGLDAEKALLAAERARQSLLDCGLPHAHGVNGMITISFGVAVTDELHTPNVQALLKNADDALYQAKLAGRNCCKLARPPASPHFIDEKTA